MFLSPKESIKIKNHPNSKTNMFCLCVFVFVIGCFIGYVVEVVYEFIKHGEFINKQGMIYGPFNQIYGFGALVFTLALYKFRNSKKIVIFIMGSLLGGVFEYVCSFIQEKIFNSESWNYSSLPLSLNGRTNLMHAAFWGILGLLFIIYCMPFIVKLLQSISFKTAISSSVLLLVFMIFNMTISSISVLRYIERLEHEAPSNQIEVFLDQHYDDELIKKVYPKTKFFK